MGQLAKEQFVCMDCETTGLDVNTDRIIEVAVARFSFDGILDQYESLIDPEREIPEISIAIHNITAEMVLGKPKIQDVLQDILKFIGNATLVGHGILFDIQMIHNAALRQGIESDLQKNLFIDTLRLARLYGESPVNSLDRLRQHFNIENEGAHRAMNDVLVNISVFKQLSRRFKTTEQILEALSKPILMKTMPLGKHKGRFMKDIPLEYIRWAANKDFDEDLLFSLRTELIKRKKGTHFSHSANPFSILD